MIEINKRKLEPFWEIRIIIFYSYLINLDTRGISHIYLLDATSTSSLLLLSQPD